MFRFALFLLLLCPVSAKTKPEINLVGPRAGMGIIEHDNGTRLEGGVHSQFGWEVEVPYRAEAFTGYGEAGALMVGAEQGVLWPEAWGFFGVRFRYAGMGAGPVLNPLGLGIGFGLFGQLVSGDLRLPVGVNFSIVDGTARSHLLIGFSYL